MVRQSLRLAAENVGETFGGGAPVEEFSEGHNWARYCSDTPFVWDEQASLSTRLRQWSRARSRLEPRDFGPFSIGAWLAPFPIGPLGPDGCIAWPAPKRKVERPVPRGARYPAKVPALVITGDLDVNISTDYSRPIARRWRGSDYVEIANNGHHGAISWRGDCADPIIVNFIAEHEPGDTGCARRWGKLYADRSAVERAPGEERMGAAASPHSRVRARPASRRLDDAGSVGLRPRKGASRPLAA